MPTYNLVSTGANSGHIDNLVGVSYTKSTATPAEAFEQDTGGEENVLVRSKQPFSFFPHSIPNTETVESATLSFTVGGAGTNEEFAGIILLSSGTVTAASGAQTIDDRIIADAGAPAQAAFLAAGASQSFTVADITDLLTIIQSYVASGAAIGFGVYTLGAIGCDFTIAEGTLALQVITTAPPTGRAAKLGGGLNGQINGGIN